MTSARTTVGRSSRCTASPGTAGAGRCWPSSCPSCGWSPWTSAATATPPRRRRGGSSSTSRTSSPCWTTTASTASRCSATRSAARSRSTWPAPPGSGSSGWCSSTRPSASTPTTCCRPRPRPARASPTPTWPRRGPSARSGGRRRRTRWSTRSWSTTSSRTRTAGGATAGRRLRSSPRGVRWPAPRSPRPPDLPTLLLPAAKVDYVNPAWVERVRAELGDRLVVQEMDTAHMVYLEQPVETAAAIRAFLG